MQEDFKEFIDTDGDKNNFIKAFSKIFAMLLNTNLNIVDKIKRIEGTDIETTHKIWLETVKKNLILTLVSN